MLLAGMSFRSTLLALSLRRRTQRKMGEEPFSMQHRAFTILRPYHIREGCPMQKLLPEVSPGRKEPGNFGASCAPHLGPKDPGCKCDGVNVVAKLQLGLLEHGS